MENIYTIKGIDGMESDAIEDVLSENKIRFETFHVGNGIFEIEIQASKNQVEYLLKSNNIIS